MHFLSNSIFREEHIFTSPNSNFLLFFVVCLGAHDLCCPTKYLAEVANVMHYAMMHFFLSKKEKNIWRCNNEQSDYW